MRSSLRWGVKSDGQPVIIFPHAGGAASGYRAWLGGALGSAAEVAVVQYPGREDRLHEELPSTLPKLAEVIAHDIVMAYPGREVVLFGASMGGLVAFEVAKALERPGSLLVKGLALAACAAPTIRRPSHIDALDDEQFVEWLCDFDASNAVLREQEIADVILPSIRADLRAVGDYEAAQNECVNCPITAFVPAWDRTTDELSVRDWSNFTTAAFTVHVISGDHFFAAAPSARLLSVLADHVIGGTGVVAG